MGEKKRKKHSAQTAHLATRKHNEPTAFELAFREAEGQKDKNAVTKKAVSSPIPAAKVAKQTQQFAMGTSPIINPPPSTTAPPKEKRVYIPPPTVAPKMKKIVARPQPSKKRHNLTKPAPPVARGKPSVNMGLKPVLRETLVLDTSVSQGENQKHLPIKNQKIEGTVGRSQVHNGDLNPKRNPESDIVIGFDFGTSSSKIVIRDSGRQTAYAVPFGSLACTGNSYLIPTTIFISDDGILSLSAGKHSCSSLKTHIMDDPGQTVFTATKTSQSITASELAAAYIALVIRFARAWFLKHTESIYKKTHIHWHINLGIPSKNYDDQRIRNTFQTISMAAWRISRLDSAITIAVVKKYLEKAGNHIAAESKDIKPDDYESRWLHHDFVNTHPEIIMEIVGYARSPLRLSGLHLIVDVGATTLDSATFFIHNKDGEDVFSLLETTVERHGTMVLHNRRIQALKSSLQKTLQQKKTIDPTAPLPDSAHYKIKAGNKDIADNDARFFQQCSAKIGQVIRDTQKRRDPYSGAWKRGLPVFICGGGGRLYLYREMIENLGSRIASTDFKGFIIKEIPKPDQLDAPDLPPQEYDRLAIAYGLSFTSFEIGTVISESKVSDIHKEDKILNTEDRFVSKDMC